MNDNLLVWNWCDSSVAGTTRLENGTLHSAIYDYVIRVLQPKLPSIQFVYQTKGNNIDPLLEQRADILLYASTATFHPDIGLSHPVINTEFNIFSSRHLLLISKV